MAAASVRARTLLLAALLAILGAAIAQMDEFQGYSEEINSYYDAVVHLEPDQDEYPSHLVDCMVQKFKTRPNPRHLHYYFVVWGNKIPTDNKHMYNLQTHDGTVFDVPYKDQDYKLAIFTKGWFNKCGYEEGSENWTFTFNKDHTVCYADGATDPMPCENPGKCLIEWDCPNQKC